MERETIRRTWYSLYVLDRLLALQLGRPVAIHEDEYYVDLPSKSEESPYGEPNKPSPDKTSSSIDYFVSVIKFSKILGQVISDLYRPSQVAIEPDQMLLSTTTLDEKLIKWKLGLPRHLRFDLGHTFEKSMIFKRQARLSVQPLQTIAKKYLAEYACHQIPPSPHADAPSISLLGMGTATQPTLNSFTRASPPSCRYPRKNLRPRGPANSTSITQRCRREKLGARLPLVADDLLSPLCEFCSPRRSRVY